jgi:hypothetical protein
MMRRSSTRKAQEAWRRRARGVHGTAIELHDLIATELVAARSGAQLSAVAGTDASSTFDEIDAELRELQADPPSQTSGVAAQDLALSTSAVRSALLVLTSATGDDEVRRGLVQTLSERLAAMETSIGRFGSSLGPGPVTR